MINLEFLTFVREFVPELKTDLNNLNRCLKASDRREGVLGNMHSYKQAQINHLTNHLYF